MLEKPKQVVSHDEIIEQVWGDNYQGVTPNNIAQYIRPLRKILVKYRPDKTFIGTSPKRGYIFEEDVFIDGESIKDADLENPEINGAGEYQPFPIPPTDTTSMQGALQDGKNYRLKLLIPLSALLIVVAVAATSYFSVSDEDQVRQVVKDSQMYESLVLYKNPSSFKEADLDKYWTTELDLNANYDRRKIRDAVGKLLGEGRRYGDETKCEQFEFQSVEVSSSGDLAVVKTLEKWFIAVYLKDGTLQKNRNVGPYFVSYIVRKVDGRWLIEKSNTARANLPSPRLSKVEAVTEIKGGQQFFVRLTGEDFVTENVFIKVVGEGCPEAVPCTVPNSILRKYSKLTEKTIDNVPMTLARGEFLLFVQNGESQASSSIKLNVP